MLDEGRRRDRFDLVISISRNDGQEIDIGCFTADTVELRHDKATHAVELQKKRLNNGSNVAKSWIPAMAKNGRERPGRGELAQPKGFSMMPACQYDHEFDGTNIEDFELMIEKQ
ncbi:MAG: hypothetical protein ACREP8_04840 [Candidatus Binatia bacterium]